LKRIFGERAVATEGVDYAALISTNALPGGTDALSRALMQRTINDMASKCPNSVIVTGGYSQGAAVNHRAIESLPQNVKDRIAGVILYGDTQKLQVGFPAAHSNIRTNEPFRTATRFLTSRKRRSRSSVTSVIWFVLAR
jgi:hypothetical protein